MLLAAHTKEELSSCQKQIQQAAIPILTKKISDGFVRIGIGTIESGLNGIEKTFQNSVIAVNVGEKFKKERRVLDYIGMQIYSAINAMVLAYGSSLIDAILLQLTEQEQTILGKYYMQRTDPSDCCCIKYQYGRGHKCIKTDKNKNRP